MKLWIPRIHQYVSNKLREERGATMVYFALILMMLLGMASIAVDSSNAHLQYRRMQNAADAAALAGARELALQQGNSAVDTTVQALASANGSTTTDWEYTDDGKGVIVTTGEQFDTYFAGVIDVDIMTSTANATVAYAPIEITDRLLPLAINGCDCLEFESFPLAIGQDDFGEIVIGIYNIGNTSDGGAEFVFDLAGLDTSYPVSTENRPYNLFSDQGGNGIYTVYGDGSAHTVERVYNSAGDGFLVDLWFSGRTSSASGDSPYCGGGCPNTTDWHYYPTVTGTLSGLPGTRYENAIIQVTQQLRAAQVGTNAHLAAPTATLGSMAWLALTVETQPNTGAVLEGDGVIARNRMVLRNPTTPMPLPTPTSVMIASNTTSAHTTTSAVSIPLPGVALAASQESALNGFTLPANVAPVATLAADSLQRVAFQMPDHALSTAGTVGMSSHPVAGELTTSGFSTVGLSQPAAASAVRAAAPAMLPAAAANYCPGNRLMNASFEQVNANGVPYYWSGNANTGNHGYVIPDGVKYGYSWGPAGSAMKQAVDVVPGGTYSMSFYSSSHEPGYQVVKLQYLKANGAPIGSPASHTITVDIDHPSHVFGGPYTLSLPAAPALATKVQVFITANNVDWAKVDKLCLTGIEPTATPAATSTPTATSTPMPTATATPTMIIPTATPTAAPTNTPLPTATMPQSTPTATVPQPTPTPSTGTCALDDAALVMARYSLIVLDDLWTNSDVEGRTFVGGNITSADSANFGINVSGVAAEEAMLVVVGDIVGGNPLQLNAGSLRLGGSANGRLINYNGGGSLIPDTTQSDGPVTTMLQDASAQLAALPVNNMAQLPAGQPGPARFNVTSVNDDGAAIFEVAADQLFNNGAQQIELNPGSASMVVINVTGATINWTSGNMVGSFTDYQARSRIIWNFPQASTINFNGYNMMGAMLAPYAHVTTSANIDGAVAVRALTTTSEIHQPTLTAALGTLCDSTENPSGDTPCELVWLDWDGGLSSNDELADYILDPSRSGVRRVGETVAAGPVVQNVSQVTAALDTWLNKPMKIALYDEGDQTNGYQICGFAELTMSDYDFSTVPAWLTGQFDVGLSSGGTSTEIVDFGLRGLYIVD